MTKRLILILTIVLSALNTWSQIRITGAVISNDDKQPLPGVMVQEKGIENGTITNIDGSFSIEVSDPNSTLIFSYIGMITQEVPLKGKTQIHVIAKWDCHKDFFDSKQIILFVNSGLINNPLGGQIEVASPSIIGGVVKGLYSYQTNDNENELHNGHIELNHFISNCDFDIDFRWSYRHVIFNNLSFKTNSLESDLNIRSIKLLAGLTHLSFRGEEATKRKNSMGVLIGFGTYFNMPLYPTSMVKISLYNNKIEYQASIQGGYKRLFCFLKFYKLNSFNELSVGIGTNFYYR